MAEQYTITPQNYNPDTKWLSSIFKCEDEYGKMMRMALYLEDEIDKLIVSQKVAKDINLKNGDIEFSTKVLILRALRVEATICNNIEKINSIRNKFAHKKEMSFEDQAMRDRIQSLLQNPGFQHGENDVPLDEFEFSIECSETGNVETKFVKNMGLADKLTVFISMLVVFIHYIPNSPIKISKKIKPQ